ncbi:MAG: manganese efflux pump MntP family protein [Treponema sp.]|jgi:putative Mn2+ efflux pump MntP|nr:manganese efflux pump MntP family protein [Treponema sp.]
MGLLEIVLIAVGLSMDAFAVSISLGLSAKKPRPVEILLPGLYFGFFQSLMPAAGYFAGAYSAQKIEKIDHWIALVLLGFIGGKMIKDGLARKNGEDQKETEAGNAKNPFGFPRMLVLAVATSIDALAVGITFAFFKVHLPTALLITGATTFVIAMGGVVIGGAFGTRYKAKAECAGGAVLVLIGIKIAAGHLFFS